VRLRIDLEQGTFAPGDRVAGAVVVLDGGRSRGATAQLRFVERSVPFEHVACETDPVRLTDAELVTGDLLPFELALPEDALPSLHTGPASLLWELRVQVDVPMMPDSDERIELVVGS
jgi:hypothetical protein